MPTQFFTPNSFQTFGDLLKYLRRRERLTQLELSITVGYSEAQISRLEQNQRMPDVAALKALFIPALHIEGEPEITARLIELAQSARQEDAPLPGIAPYKGLLYFEESDSELFFGREALTARLADRITDLSQDSSSRFLAVVGASGSGKSSLVRAGLVFALKRAGWDTRVFTPTANPMKALDTQLYSSPASVKSEYTLILVDQFEETFTLCRDEAERVSFIEKLLDISRDKSGRIVVVIALRADFYSHCAQYPLLRQAVATEQEYIGQMTVEELRRAIEEPAEQGGWEFEQGLVDVLLQDIGAQGTSEPEPGALPLLSHAMLATWERRRGRTFTLEGYHASGGVRGAIAETAESVFADQLNQSQQELARDVFLRLTELGEGTEDTRRRATLNELVRQSAEATQLRTVLNTLAEARLITLNENSAEVAHEALIREWQRLHDWLTQDRDGLRLHRHLTESTHEWETRGHDASELYRGARLAQTHEWASSNEERLNESERAFLEASIEQEQHDALEREAQRQRELEVAQKLADTEKQSLIRLRGSNRVISAVGFLALILAGIAILFSRQMTANAKVAQANAAAAQAEAQSRATAEANAVNNRNIAQQQSLIASVRELSGAANLNLDVDPERSILLALQAMALTNKSGQPPLIEAQDALHRAVQTSRVQATFHGHTSEIMGIAYSRDGTKLATIADDNTIKIWEAATGKELISIPTGNLISNVYRHLSFSSDGTRIASSASDNLAKVWDVASGKELLTLKGHTDNVTAAIFSRNGKWIGTSSVDQTTKIWDSTTGQEILTLTGQNDVVDDVAFSPDGKYIATAGDTTGVMIWDAATGKPVFNLPVFDGSSAVAFSPDNKTLATGGFDTTWSLWDVATGRKLLTQYGHASRLADISFDSSGDRIVTASEDGTAKIWDALTGRELFTLAGHASGVLGAAFSPDGTHVASASRDTTVKIWDASPNAGSEWFNLIGNTDRVYDAVYSPDGKYIATAAVDGKVKLWDATTAKELSSLMMNNSVWTVAFSSDGTRLVAGSSDLTDNNIGVVAMWDVATAKEILSIPVQDFSGRLAYSPDSSLIATGGLKGEVIIWDAHTGKKLRTVNDGHNDFIQYLAFDPDGSRLAITGGDGSLKIWDPVTGKELLNLNIPTDLARLAFSPNGKWIATTGNDAAVYIWDSATGEKLYTLTGHSGPTFGVAFSSDGKYLATSSVDRTVKIWNVSDNFTSLPLTLYGHTGAVYSVAFSPDDKRILTASRDTTARVYAFSIQDLISIAKSRLTRSLTTEECQQYLHLDVCPTAP